MFRRCPAAHSHDAAVRAPVGGVKDAIVLQDRPNAYTVLTGNQVKVSFFGDIDCGRVGEPLLTEDNVLCVASLEDLLAHKLKVIMQRVESKDYRDIIAILRSGKSLERGLASAVALFGNAFAAAEALKALVYFKEGDLEQLSADERQFLIGEVARVRTLPRIDRLADKLGPALPTG